MSQVSIASKAQWLQSKIRLAHARQQAIRAAFQARFGAAATQAIAELPVPPIHPQTLEDRIALTETREAALLTAFNARWGHAAHQAAAAATRRHGAQTGHAASKRIHTTHTAAKTIYHALSHFLLDGGPQAPEPRITHNRPEQITWSRNVCPQHALWFGNTESYLLLVQMEGEWISGFVETYCYSAAHERRIFMNVGPASYSDTISVKNLKW